MLWTVRRRWPERIIFAFNCERYLVNLLLHQPGDAPVLLLSHEVATHGRPLSMVLYGTTLVLLAEELMDADPTLLSPFYANDAAFDGSERWSAAQLRLLMGRCPDRGYFSDPANSLFIADNPEEKEASKREFERAVLNLNCLYGSRCMGGYWEPREELKEWVRPTVEAWSHRFCTLAKIEKWYPQLSYAGLVMLLHLEWQYLQRAVPGVSSMMGPIGDFLIEAFFPALFGGE